MHLREHFLVQSVRARSDHACERPLWRGYCYYYCLLPSGAISSVRRESIHDAMTGGMKRGEMGPRGIAEHGLTMMVRVGLGQA